MKTTLVASMLLASMSSFASSLYGTYVGVTQTKLGFDRACVLEITELTSNDIHFEMKREKGILNPQIQRLMSIKGSKAYYLPQVARGELEVKKLNDLQNSSLNWGYVLPHHDEEDFGTATIVLNADNVPTEFSIVRRTYGNSYDLDCRDLKKQ